jgi:ABC-2 type transport system ATP-binding protein
MSVIEIRGVRKRYRKRDVVQDLSFEVPAGSITGFLGRNGAGKTTTLRVLLGLARPTEGTATLFGRPYAALERPARQVGAVLETGGFHPRRSGRDHLQVVGRASGLPDSRADAVLDLVGLTDSATRAVRTYSMGMRQRLAMAAALLGDPEVLILDEPTNGLDPMGIRQLRDHLTAHAAAGGTVLVSSHHLAEVAQVVDQVVIIEGGRLVVAGPASEIVGDATLEDVFFGLIGAAGTPEVSA